MPTPLGNSKDFSYRAVQVLNEVEQIIVEELKESTKWLRSQGISKPPYWQLNEHTTPHEIEELAKLCADKNVALISDAGTPNFCDPGALLVAACRKNGIAVKALPGPSSLAMILSLSSVRLDQFEFVGFLPAENSARQKALSQLSKKSNALIVMDTPYRFKKLAQELAETLKGRRLLIGLDLTSPEEIVLELTALDLFSKLPQLPSKPEFIILVYPSTISS